MLPSLLIVVLLGFSQPANADSRRTKMDPYYPALTPYESNGTRLTVSKVQRALQEDGYYVGVNTGQYGYETRAAIRRYRRDRGLPILGKIDEQLLRTLGFRAREI